MRTILIDDLRDFIDRRPAFILRTRDEGLKFLQDHHGEHFDELWLDHDLGSPNGVDEDIMKVVTYLEEAGFNDNHFNVDMIFVHTSNSAGARKMMAAFERYGYNARRVAPERDLVVNIK